MTNTTTSRNVSLDQMREHVLGLSEAHEIEIEWTTERNSEGRLEAWAGNWELPVIGTPEIADELTYGTALHEFGHFLGRHQNSRNCVVRERHAWKWARANALVWTPKMEADAVECLDWYIANADRVNKEREALEAECVALNALNKSKRTA